MIDASQWAKRLRLARSECVGRGAEVDAGSLMWAQDVIREAQIDALGQALRAVHQVMDAARPIQHLGLGKAVDALSDLTLDVAKQRSKRAT